MQPCGPDKTIFHDKWILTGARRIDFGASLFMMSIKKIMISNQNCFDCEWNALILNQFRIVYSSCFHSYFVTDESSRLNWARISWYQILVSLTDYWMNDCVICVFILSSFSFRNHSDLSNEMELHMTLECRLYSKVFQQFFNKCLNKIWNNRQKSQTVRWLMTKNNTFNFFSRKKCKSASCVRDSVNFIRGQVPVSVKHLSRTSKCPAKFFLDRKYSEQIQWSLWLMNRSTVMPAHVHISFFLVILGWLREFRGVRVNSHILEYGMCHFLSVFFFRLEDKIVGLFWSLW